MKLNFDQWMKAVDAAIEKAVGFGLSSNDLPDQNYRDMYEDGASPRSAAKQALSDA